MSYIGWRTRSWIAVPLIGVMSLALAACGGGTSPSSSSSTSAGSGTTAGATSSTGGPTSTAGGTSFNGTTITMLSSNFPWERKLATLLPAFEKQTGITVNVEALSQDQYEAKEIITFQAHSPAVDVFPSLPSHQGLQFAQAGWYQPLTSFVENKSLTPSSYDFSDFQTGPVKGETINGKLIGIPILVEGPVVFYRKDLFKQYGVAPPTTLAQLLSDAKTIYEKSNHKYVVASRGQSQALVYTFGNFLHNEGAHWATSSGQPGFKDPKAVQAIKLYATLASKYGPPGVVNNTYIQSSALMSAGRASMEIESTNELSSITGQGSNVNGKLGVIPIPSGPGGNHPTELQWGLSMSPFSQHKDAAWKFIEWATSPQIQLKLALQGIFPARKSILTSSAFKAQLASNQYHNAALEQKWAKTLSFILANGNPNVGPPAVKQIEARKVIGDAIDKVILGQSTASAAAAAIQSGLAPLLSKSASG
ncbi:MAG: ABC transporter substrate-binding protein [Acidimicrobiales bacterium]